MDRLEQTLGKAQLLPIAVLGLGVATRLLPHLPPPAPASSAELSSLPSLSFLPSLSPSSWSLLCAKCLPILLSYPCYHSPANVITGKSVLIPGLSPLWLLSNLV